MRFMERIIEAIVGVSLGTELTAPGAEPNCPPQGTKAPKCLKYSD